MYNDAIEALEICLKYAENTTEEDALRAAIALMRATAPVSPPKWEPIGNGGCIQAPYKGLTLQVGPGWLSGFTWCVLDSAQTVLGRGTAKTNTQAASNARNCADHLGGASADVCERVATERLQRAIDLVAEERRRAWEWPDGSGSQTEALDKSLTFARGVAKALGVDFEAVIRGVQAVEKNR